MKINGNAIRPGMVIEHQGRLWRAVKTQHIKPGKGGAYAQVELKDIRDGTKLNERFRYSEDVETVQLEHKTYQYLYGDGDMHTFMHAETYEQIMVGADLIGEELVPFLQEGMQVSVDTYQEETLGVTLPDSVVLKVIEADAVVRGQTAASSYKPALLENGIRILVPPHVEAGTRVVVKPSDRSYVERAKD